MRQSGFSMVELIMVIVIIGILSVIAIPRFARMTDSAKISAELSTAYSIQTAIETANGEWLVNEAKFKWGTGQWSDNNSSGLNSSGFPIRLGANNGVEYTVRDADRFTRIFNNGNIHRFRGRACNEVTTHIAGKPDQNDYWEYNSQTGTFTLVEFDENNNSE